MKLKHLFATLSLAIVAGAGVAAGLSNGSVQPVKADGSSHTFTFHVTDGDSWGNSLKAHLWNSKVSSEKNSWPGDGGTFEYYNEYGQGVYHFEVTLSFIPDHVIFSRDGAYQTPDYAFAFNESDKTNAFTVKNSSISEWDFEDVTREYYIYLNKTEVISSTNLHIFADNNNDSSYPVAWPGYEMTEVPNTGGKIYKSSAIPCKYNRLKFTSDDYSDGHQQQVNDVCIYNGKVYNSYGGNWESLIETKVQIWIDAYMHMDSDTPGQCNDYFGPAKDNLTSEVYAELGSNALFANAYKRYCDWAKALGRNPDPVTVDGAAMLPFETGTTNYSVFAIIGAVTLIAIGGFFFIRRKRA